MSPATPPPGPAPRLLGLPPDDFHVDPVGCLLRLREEFGDVFALSPSEVVLARPEWVQQVLARTNRQFRLAASGTGSSRRRPSLLRDRTETWMSARRSGQWRRLGKPAVQSFEARIRAAMAAFVDQIAARGPAGFADCEAAAFDALSGVFIHDLEPDLRDKLFSAAAASEELNGAALRLPAWLSRRTRRGLRANDDVVEALIEHVERRRRRSAPDATPADILDLLLRAQARGHDDLGAVEIAQTLSTNLGNAHGVGGAGLAWLFVSFCEHEVVRPDRASRRSWAEAVASEVLRMYPAIPLTGRLVAEPAEFGGRVVAAGRRVIVSPALLHLDKRWWREDPAKFAPSRWFESKVHEPHAYLPFLAGPRVCFGAQLARRLLESAALALDGRNVRTEPSPPVSRRSTVAAPKGLRVWVGPA